MADSAVNGGGEGEEPEYEDILGDCTILVKRIVVNKNPSPKVGESVTIRWTKEIPELEKSFSTEDLTFTLGDGDVEQAVELITSLMKLGEKFTCIAGYKYMYGEFGQEPDVPAKANFKFDIELLSNNGIVDYPNMDFDTRFNEAKKKKERGNILFRRRDYPQALNLYMTACKIVDRDLGFDYPDEAPEKLQEVQEFRAVILCNTSVAQLKSQLYDAAVLSAREATKICPSYSKAFYRLGQAYERTGQIGETIKAYKKALDLNSDDSKVKLSDSELSFLESEVEKLTEKQQKLQTSEKQMYSRMFGGDTSVTDASDKTKAKTLTKTKDNNSNSVQPGKIPDETKDQQQRPKFRSSYKSLSEGQGIDNPPQSNTESIDKSMFAAGMKAAQQVLAESVKGQNAMASAAHHPESESVNQVPAAMQEAARKAATQFPDIESSLAKLTEKVNTGMTQEEALSMASETLNQMGLGAMNQNPAYLMAMSEKLAAMIPDDVREHFEEILKKQAQDTEDANSGNRKNILAEATKSDAANSDGRKNTIAEATKSKDINMKAESAIAKGAIAETKKNSSSADANGAGNDNFAAAESKPEAASDECSTKNGNDLKGLVNLWEKKIQEHMYPSNIRAAREELMRKSEEREASRRKTLPEQAPISEAITRKKTDLHAKPTERRLKSDQDAEIKKIENVENVSDSDKLKSCPKISTKAKSKLNVNEVNMNGKGLDSKQIPDLDTTISITNENGPEPEKGLTESEEDLSLDSLMKGILEDGVRRQEITEAQSTVAAELDKGKHPSETSEIQEVSRGFEEEFGIDDHAIKGSWLETAGYTVLGVGVVGLVGYGIYRYTRK